MTTTRAARVVAGLKDKIFAGDLPAGEKLPSEAELIEEFGVSRTVVREAVARLQAEGLVETFQGRGSYVLALPGSKAFAIGPVEIRTQRDVLDVVDLRLGIETEAAALAASRADKAGRESVRAALAAFESAPPEDAVEADFRFHRAVAVACGNRFFLDLLDSLGPMTIMLARTRLGEEHSIVHADHAERVRREHADIAAAIAAGDAETARAAMRVHLGNTRRRLDAGR